MNPTEPNLDAKQYLKQLSIGQTQALEHAAKLTQEHGIEYAVYRLSKRSQAFRMGYRYICARKSLCAIYEADGAKMLRKHKPAVIVLPGDEVA